jgi:hypothetical protein
MAIDSMLRSCDLVRLKVCDISRGNEILSRAQVIQKKTGKPVQFEITKRTKLAVQNWMTNAHLGLDDFLFKSRQKYSEHISTRQYSRIVDGWVTSIGLDKAIYATHSLRRTKSSIIYRETKNIRAVQILLGHTKIESTVHLFNELSTVSVQLKAPKILGLIGYLFGTDIGGVDFGIAISGGESEFDIGPFVVLEVDSKGLSTGRISAQYEEYFDDTKSVKDIGGLSFTATAEAVVGGGSLSYDVKNYNPFKPESWAVHVGPGRGGSMSISQTAVFSFRHGKWFHGED